MRDMSERATRIGLLTPPATPEKTIKTRKRSCSELRLNSISFLRKSTNDKRYDGDSETISHQTRLEKSSELVEEYSQKEAAQALPIGSNVEEEIFKEQQDCLVVSLPSNNIVKSSSIEHQIQDVTTNSASKTVVPPENTSRSFERDKFDHEAGLSECEVGERFLEESDREVQLSLNHHETSVPDRRNHTRIGKRLRPSQRRGIVSGESKFKIFDRFIRPCQSRAILNTSLLVNKSASDLTSSERLLRRTLDSQDPFRRYIAARNRNARSSNVPRVLTTRRSASASGILNPRRETALNGNRQISHGGIWTVGGPIPTSDPAILMGDVRNSRVDNRIGASVYQSSFLDGPTLDENEALFTSRLAAALDIDLAGRVVPSAKFSSAQVRAPACPLQPHMSTNIPSYRLYNQEGRSVWRDNEWQHLGAGILLEAPGLRDDFYCSVLAYSHEADWLACGLGDRVYFWSESTGVKNPSIEVNNPMYPTSYITALAFSSPEGCKAIIAVARGDGRLCFWSPYDDREVRCLKQILPNAAVAISFRPKTVKRQSRRNIGFNVYNEVLAVGDDAGVISIYCIEWPYNDERALIGWDGAVVLDCRIHIHTQQICGIAWSPEGEQFVTSGNDNACCLFNFSHIHTQARAKPVNGGEGGESSEALIQRMRPSLVWRHNDKDAMHIWKLGAAVKALAFCPWQKGLLAVGGGSNDRTIHFFHTISGATLATIDCAAQITSLIWSTTKREICVTLGFAQPEHPYRIAVYSWPKCQEIAAIPWNTEMRALHAIPYPQSACPDRVEPGKRFRRDKRRSAEQGCIAVASSDNSIKFYKIWTDDEVKIGPRRGALGSDILESLHGIDKEDGIDIIR